MKKRIDNGNKVRISVDLIWRIYQSCIFSWKNRQNRQRRILGAL